jgi:hypothetical protein
MQHVTEYVIIVSLLPTVMIHTRAALLQQPNMKPLDTCFCDEICMPLNKHALTKLYHNPTKNRLQRQQECASELNTSDVLQQQTFCTTLATEKKEHLFQ